jgi:hypothetical protein
MHRFFVALVVVAFAAAPGCGDLEETTADQQSPAYPSTGEPADEAVQEIGGFSALSFPFKTTVEDDGADVGGGYQVAQANLKFADGRQTPTMTWTCSFKVGMPLRTARFGKIDPIHAAIITAEVATLSASPVMHSRDVWLPVLFCSKFKDKMIETFLSRYSGLGGGIFQ